MKRLATKKKQSGVNGLITPKELLTDLEEKIISIIGNKSVNGDAIREVGFQNEVIQHLNPYIKSYIMIFVYIF